MLYKKMNKAHCGPSMMELPGTRRKRAEPGFQLKNQISGINKASLGLEIPLIWPFLPENHQKPATVSA